MTIKQLTRYANERGFIIRPDRYFKNVTGAFIDVIDSETYERDYFPTPDLAKQYIDRCLEWREYERM